MAENEQGNPFKGFKTVEFHLGNSEEMEHVLDEAIARRDKEEALKQGYKGVIYINAGMYKQDKQQQ